MMDCRRLVLDNYKYCGIEIYSSVKKRMKRHNAYSEWLDNCHDLKAAVVINAGWGEYPLMLSLIQPGVELLALDVDPDKVNVMAHRFALHHVQASAAVLDDESTEIERFLSAHPDARIYLIEPSQNVLEKYKQIHPSIIEK